MLAPMLLRAILGIALLATCVTAGAQSRLPFFRQYAAQPDLLARRQFLAAEIPRLPEAEQVFARQLLASTDGELGLYQQALHDFPFDQRAPLHALVPQPATPPTVKLIDDHSFVDPYRSADAIPAAQAIAIAAADRRIVMINEAHHDAHTRVLVLQLLPLLRAQGYDYFAAEALTEDGRSLERRGYPVAGSGTEYLGEPLYGEIVREAIRLGYTLVSYDPTGASADRDADQAANLYQRVFVRDPKARLFLLAGYAHIDKAKGQLGNVMPMAMHLQQLTGIDPLAVDQTTFREVEPERPDGVYSWMMASYRPRRPVVLRMQGGGSGLWSGDPKRYDVSVILPKAHGKPRPDWLALDGARHAWPIDTSLCAGTVPCVAEARHAGESDDAIPADRYTFLDAPASSQLYLRPGTYRLRAWGSDGRTLAEHTITVP